MGDIFDTHSHYNDSAFDSDREELLGSLFAGGLCAAVNQGTDVPSSEWGIEYSKKYKGMYAAVGLHPECLSENSFEDLKVIKKLAGFPKVVAIGEIGLDYYWNKDNKEAQKNLFIKQIEIANRLSKPIVIHNRDAIYDTLRILKEHPVQKKGIFHCCPLNPELIKEGLKLGYYISFSGNITFKNAKSFDAVSIVPMDRILIETDAPYLSPEPFRGTRNNSINVKLVAEKIAEIKKISINEVSQKTYQNAERVYEIKM